ncbi:MAG: Ca2+-binding protein (EF-Hand superfamily) [Amphiamblys sp. WSBS2006]|nr:MAG: Ca2+-binding protein (EF-Hand superfamily) [Amphiamblys sp. WSBS2006]
MGGRTSKPVKERGADRTGKKDEFAKWKKVFMAKYPDGVIEEDELFSIYSDFYPFGNCRPFCRMVFNLCSDKDKKGIYLGTFFDVVYALQWGTDGDRAGLVFQLLDCDKKGYIERGDVSKYLWCVGEMLNGICDERKTKKEHLQPALVESLDAAGKITEDEFISAVEKDIEVAKAFPCLM